MGILNAVIILKSYIVVAEAIVTIKFGPMHLDLVEAVLAEEVAGDDSDAAQRTSTACFATIGDDSNGGNDDMIDDDYHSYSNDTVDS